MLNKYFPQREFKALLFDFDGTIADSMPAHFKAWNLGLAIYNLTLSRDQHQAWAGRPTRMILEMLNEMHKTTIPVEEFLKAKEEHYMTSLHEIQTIVPVMEIIKFYHEKLPMAVVTGSRRQVVEATMKHLDLMKYFDHLVCAEDYKNGKPAPDCFLLGAKLLNVEPKDCLVFEDAELGVQAGLAAGMNCLRLDEKGELVLIK